MAELVELLIDDMVALTFGVVEIIGFIDIVEFMVTLFIIDDNSVGEMVPFTVALGVAGMLEFITVFEVFEASVVMTEPVELLIGDVVAFTFGMVEVIGFIIIVEIIVAFIIDDDLVAEMVLFIIARGVADMLAFIPIFEVFDASVVMVEFVELLIGNIVALTFGVVEVIGFIDIVEFMVTLFIIDDNSVGEMVPFTVALGVAGMLEFITVFEVFEASVVMTEPVELLIGDVVAFTFGVVEVIGFIIIVEIIVAFIIDDDLVAEMVLFIIARGVADMLAFIPIFEVFDASVVMVEFVELLIGNIVAFTFGAVEFIGFIDIVEIMVTFIIDDDFVVIGEMVLLIITLGLADMLAFITIFIVLEAFVVMVEFVELLIGDMVAFILTDGLEAFIVVGMVITTTVELNVLFSCDMFFFTATDIVAVFGNLDKLELIIIIDALVREGTVSFSVGDIVLITKAECMLIFGVGEMKVLVAIVGRIVLYGDCMLLFSSGVVTLGRIDMVALLSIVVAGTVKFVGEELETFILSVVLLTGGIVIL